MFPDTYLERKTINYPFFTLFLAEGENGKKLRRDCHKAVCSGTTPGLEKNLLRITKAILLTNEEKDASRKVVQKT